MNVRVEHGNCLEIMPRLIDEGIHVDSIVTDPPYHLTSIVKRFGQPGGAPAKAGATGAYKRHSTGFMGKQWDGGDIAFQADTWALCFTLLKPGGHMLVFGIPRAHHRAWCAIEDAGFEIRDTVLWLFGSGFPKSHDVSKGIDRAAGAEREVLGPNRFDGISGKANLNVYGVASRPPETAPTTEAARQWQGWGTALKPACEFICIARKPLIGTVAKNVLEHGTGALNIDGGRVSADGEVIHTPQSDPAKRAGVVGADLGISRADKADFTAAQRVSVEKANTLGRWPTNVIHDGSEEVLEAFAQFGESQSPPSRERTPDPPPNVTWGLGRKGGLMVGHDDSGTAARFFYTAKADKTDRCGSKHPTVKPLDLIQYLVRLITPPGGTVLDPFAGTGTTGEAAQREGFNGILIEREAEYVADIERRLSRIGGGDTPLFQSC